MSFVDLSSSTEMLRTDLSIAEARRGWNVLGDMGGRGVWGCADSAGGGKPMSVR